MQCHRFHSQHGNEQGLEAGIWEGGEGIRVSDSCFWTTTEHGPNENTVVFHSMTSLSTAEGPSHSFVLIRDCDRSDFLLPFYSGFLTAPHLSAKNCSQTISQSAHHLQPQSCKSGRSSHACCEGKMRTNKDKPFEYLGSGWDSFN